MHVSPLSYKIGASQIFVKNFSAKNKQIFEFGLVQPGPKGANFLHNMTLDLTGKHCP